MPTAKLKESTIFWNHKKCIRNEATVIDNFWRWPEISDCIAQGA